MVAYAQIMVVPPNALVLLAGLEVCVSLMIHVIQTHATMEALALNLVELSAAPAFLDSSVPHAMNMIVRIIPVNMVVPAILALANVLMDMKNPFVQPSGNATPELNGTVFVEAHPVSIRRSAVRVSVITNKTAHPSI